MWMSSRNKAMQADLHRERDCTLTLVHREFFFTCHTNILLAQKVTGVEREQFPTDRAAIVPWISL